jgi:hypothetical protein
MPFRKALPIFKNIVILAFLAAILVSVSFSIYNLKQFYSLSHGYDSSSLVDKVNALAEKYSAIPQLRNEFLTIASEIGYLVAKSSKMQNGMSGPITRQSTPMSSFDESLSASLRTRTANRRGIADNGQMLLTPYMAHRQSLSREGERIIQQRIQQQIRKQQKQEEQLNYKNTQQKRDRESILRHSIVNSDKSQMKLSMQSQVVDLIIGLAQNINPRNFAVFCASAREHMSADTTDIIIFVNINTDSKIYELSRIHNVQLLKFDASELPDRYLEGYHPSTLRWRLIFNFFAEVSNRAKYKRVLLADVRDTYFQQNPFTTIFPSGDDGDSGLYVFSEDNEISTCSWNSGWIRDCFGNSTLALIENNSIICSGITMGSTELVYNYVTIMNNIISG